MNHQEPRLKIQIDFSSKIVFLCPHVRSMPDHTKSCDSKLRIGFFSTKNVCERWKGRIDVTILVAASIIWIPMSLGAIRCSQRPLHNWLFGLQVYDNAARSREFTAKSSVELFHEISSAYHLVSPVSDARWRPNVAFRE